MKSLPVKDRHGPPLSLCADPVRGHRGDPRSSKPRTGRTAGECSFDLPQTEPDLIVAAVKAPESVGLNEISAA